MDIVQCKRGFIAFVDGRRVRVAVGDLYSADDPIAVAHAAVFGPLDVKSSAPRVAPPRRAAAASETATAAPGERRQSARGASPAKGKGGADA